MLVGLGILFLVGRSFYRLAEKYKKQKLGFAILGVASYYIGSFVAGIAIVLFYELVLEKSIDLLDEWKLNLMAIPFGVLACWGTYRWMQRAWQKGTQAAKFDTLDGGFMEETRENGYLKD